MVGTEERIPIPLMDYILNVVRLGAFLHLIVEYIDLVQNQITLINVFLFSR